MHLELYGDSRIVNVKFAKWLLPKIKQQFKELLNKDKVKTWDLFLKDKVEYQRIDKKPIDTYDILITSINFLTYYKAGDHILIKLPNNQLLPNHNLIKIEPICKLINYGNLQIKGYPIFTDTFTSISNDLEDYTKYYMEGI